LVVPFRRLARRGFAPAALLQEIAGAARMLLDDPDLSLLEGEGAATGESATVSDGLGGRWQLVGSRPADPGRQTSLELLAVTASLALELATLREGPPEAEQTVLSGVVAASAAMRSVLRDLERVAASSSTVLILGESGVGKEIAARAVHRFSGRADRPFVTFNAATVPRELFEGQLFGYRRGAFTGATQDHEGVVRAADGGTLFLDEIGDMPLDAQAKLLRFLENGEVLTLGETRARTVDVRVVAATHRDLDEMVSQRTFREDLFYRLQVVPVRLPPLRARRDDILPLARHFLGTLSAMTPALSSEAIVALRSHDWPGNARELRNVIERSLAFAPHARVLEAHQIRLSVAR
jgi:transcriptional regulator with PAS, ATPase and Fis domain